MAHITFPKRDAAYQNHGRGMDNTHQAGRYWIQWDGHTVGYMEADKRQYMQPASWRAYTFAYGIENRQVFPLDDTRAYDTLREAKERFISRWS